MPKPLKTERNARMLDLYDREGWTVEELAEMFNVSHQRASVIVREERDRVARAERRRVLIESLRGVY